MTDENFKQSAKCRFYPECAIYQSGILREEVEKELCSEGQPIQKDYIPRIHKTYTPPTKDSVAPSEYAVCPAFKGKIDIQLIGNIRKHIEQYDWFWQR